MNYMPLTEWESRLWLSTLLIQLQLGLISWDTLLDEAVLCMSLLERESTD